MAREITVPEESVDKFSWLTTHLNYLKSELRGLSAWEEGKTYTLQIELQIKKLEKILDNERNVLIRGMEPPKTLPIEDDEQFEEADAIIRSMGLEEL